MRTLATEDHQARKEKILQAVIHLYIKTGKPVGSSTVLDNFKLSLSPASVRNVLAELEKEGYLTHPHTSAGRIPTDKGYRFYVDSIARIQKLAVEEENRIRTEYSRRMREIDDLMLSTSRVLSAMSHCTGFVLPPNLDAERLRRIELIPIDSAHVLGILVSESGIVQNHMITVDRLPDDEELRSASRFLSEHLSGLSFTEAQQRFLTELNRYQERLRAQRDFFNYLSRQLFEPASPGGLYVEGASNIYNFPEFRDYEVMRHFAQMVDEKVLLGEVLKKELGHSGLHVRIGTESAPLLKNFSVVSTCYNVRGRPVGVLGILGPKRMEYERMMAIVNTVAGLVNQALENFPESKNLLLGEDPRE